jgi:predicted nucleic acid-binding protein
MRAVLDSNVLARAVYSIGGPAEEAVRRLAAPPHVLIVSQFLLTELRRVLRYPRVQRVHGFDDHVVATAVVAGADVLCTRNRHLLHEAVLAYGRQHALEIMDDIELLRRLRQPESQE